ncbi:MAG: hypothetical protein HYU66_06540 [Armatimonadetes bacterium]|nr:hypothetical protein [Armatimonadota bacterium]
MSRRLTAAWILSAACLWGWPAFARPDVEEGRDYVLAPPDPAWSEPDFPLVVVIAEPGRPLDAVMRTYRLLTAPRGALLLVMQGGDAAKLAEALLAVRKQFSVRPNATILIGRDKMAAWARELVLQQRDVFAGLIAIDDPGIPADLPEGADGLSSRLRQAACLLVSDAKRLVGNQEVYKKLLAKGFSAALTAVPPEQLLGQLGAALNTLLPVPAARTELFDPVTKVLLRAIPGWEFVRSDQGLAVAQRQDNPQAFKVEIAAGTLGKRSFEDYVGATRGTLQGDGIELLEDQRVTRPEAPVLMHSFRFTDRRDGPERAVYWLQLGVGNQLISFRGVADPMQFAALQQAVNMLANAMSFNAPPPVDPAAPPAATHP